MYVQISKNITYLAGSFGKVKKLKESLLKMWLLQLVKQHFEYCLAR